jgi:lipopolysaccharide biosynthesis glycosyltransferase
MIENGILTIAFGSDKYVNMAINLGRSIQLNSPNIKTAIVTDSENQELTKLYNFVIPLNTVFGKNVEQKLYLDKYSPFHRTLFIDSDCLVFRDLEFAFNLFFDTHAIAIGTEFFMPGDECAFADVKKVTTNLNIKKIPRFNGGVYYVSKTSNQPNILARAREFVDCYEELGFWSFRNQGPADELLIGAAVESMGYTNISDDGKLMRTPIGIIGALNIDVFKKKSKFIKYGFNVDPAIIHFAGRIAENIEYRREIGKLSVYYNNYFLKKLRVELFHIYFNLNHYVHNSRAYLWTKTPKSLRLIYHGLKSKLYILV